MVVLWTLKMFGRIKLRFEKFEVILHRKWIFRFPTLRNSNNPDRSISGIKWTSLRLRRGRPKVDL